ncbi:hypothetical protein HPB52_015856 [Rhipicephalus sanguineus]|uniref:Pancreatic trypsin inhibitor n=1 Tax=Rhipicephalus sanguineus TaxID=34632 RepID=A0A9D4T5S3_RHISA|nr:hypothetical protein HPB52_015856 [Rhipicephalus sanguineus]
MVGSSKKRKSSLRAPSPHSRERRVSFVVPSVGESTTHTDGPPAAPAPTPPAGVPPAAPHPYGGDVAPWNQNSPYYESMGAPMRSSTAAFFGSWSCGPLAEQATAAYGPFWVRPAPLGSRWFQAIQPFSGPELFSEVSVHNDDDDAKTAPATLRNICVASITAVILAVVILVALVAESSVPIIETGPSEMSRVAERFHSGEAGIAAPWQPTNPPEATRKSVSVAPRPSTSSPRRVTNRQRVLPAAPRRAASTTTRRMTIQMASTRRPSGNRTLPHQCSSHFYTYCTTAVREFYYSASSHACLSTEVDSVHLCNHGSNRFPNLGSCLASCVHGGRGEPHDRCYENALFGTCTRQDVAETWWSYKGSACAAWNFPLGKCPSMGLGVYHSRRDCERSCLPRQESGNTTASAHRRCQTPVAVTCTLNTLKYPYFADMRAQGSVRCVKASNHTLRHRRCLIGSNRFNTIASCERSCVHL